MDAFVVSDWTEIEGYKVYPWSIAGLETCVVVKNEDLMLAFDMGYSCHQSVSCDHVFISHGHMDHISGVPNHAAKRGLQRMKAAKYYVPEGLVSELCECIRAFCRISEAKSENGNTSILPIYPGVDIQLPKGYYAVPFPTVHRVPNVGYILYKNHQKLKEEYKGLPNEDIKELIKKRVGIHDVYTTAEIAYTGDTTFEIFENPPKDFLYVKLLITEVTYIEEDHNKDMVIEARKRGHVHLSEIVNHAHLFENIGTILMIHFSDKYSPQQIKDTVFTSLPTSLKGKVYVATLAKEKTMTEM